MKFLFALLSLFVMLVTDVFAADVCVFVQPDGSVRINFPNPKMKQRNESDADFVRRMCVEATLKDPSLGSNSFVTPQTNLPSRSTREQWKAEGEKVIVGPIVVQ